MLFENKNLFLGLSYVYAEHRDDDRAYLSPCEMLSFPSLLMKMCTSQWFS